jgi:hypothetical protein
LTETTIIPNYFCIIFLTHMPEIKSNSIGRYLKRKKVVLREAAVRTSVYLSVCLCPSVCRSVYLSAECSFVHDNVRKNASILFFFGQNVCFGSYSRPLDFDANWTGRFSSITQTPILYQKLFWKTYGVCPCR